MNKSIKWYTKSGTDKTKASILFGGDICPAGRPEESMLAGQAIFDDYIQTEIERSDLFIVNLEAPLCIKELRANNPSGFGLRADGNVAEWLKNTGVDIAGIANNHLRDFLDEGVVQTMENLDRAGIEHVGGGKTLAEAEEMLITEVNGLKVGLWMLAERERNVATDSRPGSSFFNPDVNVQKIPQLRKEVDFLALFVHAGYEFASVPSPRIRRAYRAFIDAGADIVVGHHPHVPEGIEQYGDGWIAYSLGNLIFDPKYISRDKNTDHGYFLNIGISEHAVEHVEIIPYYLRNHSKVETCTEKELADYKNMLKEISSCITDDEKFEESWEEFVIWFWQEMRQSRFRNFTKHFLDEDDPGFIMYVKAIFTCPAESVILEKAMDLILQGKLSR